MLLAKYNTMWSEFENKVCFINADSDITDTNGSWQIKSTINYPENKDVKEERERANEAERRAEE